MGIRTVAVYSDADADAKHVLACDEAVRIGPAAPKESYLRADRILAAAQQTGAEAVHPGYGFLSENEGFAEACAAAGIVFVGPPPSAIKAMGLKSESKRLMGAAGVPLVPGYHGAEQDPALLQREADRIGYPVLIKASAGGGGKGMRTVAAAEAFAPALASCQREARNSFGDDAVLIERYVTRPRHIEIQVFADAHGHCLYLFERDCSVQRRHQKVLEEAPAPGMSAARRREMGEAAVAAARAVGYVGAGTVEFIAEPVGDGSGDLRFYFMEMNTRLQVEHPVTEAITGLDLVEWQLRVAAGEALPLTQDELAIDGHAIEARISAENPDAGFLPATGRLEVYRLPPAIEFARGSDAQVRVDGGVREGDSITPHYDPMIAKLIVHGRDRAEALARLDAALAQTRIVGVQTNVAFLRRVVRSASFANADLDTALIERERRCCSSSRACRSRSRPPASSPMRSRSSGLRRAPIRGRAATAGACTAARCAASTSQPARAPRLHARTGARRRTGAGARRRALAVPGQRPRRRPPRRRARRAPPCADRARDRPARQRVLGRRRGRGRRDRSDRARRRPRRRGRPPDRADARQGDRVSREGG
jgi:3-methylcrotonyl-CoA carboxylase alpha subunit